MAFLQHQVSDARASYEIRTAASNCPNGQNFLDLLNVVTSRLMKRGGFWETEIVMKLCAYDCYVVWPRQVGTVLGVRFCDHDQSPLRNNWWAIVGQQACGDRWRSTVVIQDGPTSPTFRPVSGTTGKLLRYYVVKNTDYGKTITIYGKQYGGQPLQRLSGGAWIPGIVITSANPFGTNTTGVTSIEAVTRQATEGMAYLYEYNATDDTLIMLAEYAPNETNPRLRTSIIKNICAIPSCEDENGRKIRRLEALIKLQFVPYVADTDFLFIDDYSALALGIQAILLEQANDHAGSEVKWAQAIRELNYGIRDKQPELQTAIRLNVWGDGSPALVNQI